jgi:ectoine hydroxylase-related dioxygenase (phytanoyl-CoA dioxygenase family)
LHRDDAVFLWRHPTYGREARLQIMVALSDFTADNGATLVIPRSHLWDDDRRPERSEAIPAVMQAGSALLFLGSTYHGGGENCTADQVRTGLTTGLDLSFLRQEENMYLSLPADVVRSYPDEIQRLLGWSAGRNFLGWIEIDGQMTDPIVLLQDAAAQSASNRL